MKHSTGAPLAAMKPPPENNHESSLLPLDDCRPLLTSLSRSIPSLRSFPSRWASVSATLDRLLLAVDDLTSLPSNPLSSDLLRLLAQTLTFTLSISAQCLLPSPPAGRLRTQSDLASASSSLSQLASDASFLLRSSSLLNPFPSSTRQTRSLIARLQIGSISSRIPALDSLLSMLNEENDNNNNSVRIAASEGLVPALVSLLDRASSASSDHEARDKAVAAIARVSSVESCRHLVVEEEAGLLVSLLSRALVEPEGFGSAKENACAALRSLTLRRDVAMTVGSGGTISVLLQVCRFGTPSAQAAAAGVLKNLAVVPELREKLVEENAVPVFVGVLRSGTVAARENSASCLSNLIAGEEEQSIKLAVLQQGVLDCIGNYWEAPAVDNRDLEPAIRLLRKLSSSSVFSEMVLSSGFLPRIILALDSASGGTRTEAVKAVAELALVCTNNDEGLEHAVPRIVRMLGAKAKEEKAAAAKALASLMAFSSCRRLMRKDEKGILDLMMLLDSSVCDVEKKDVVTVLLAAAARSRRCRKLMVASGARGLLPWLESMEVEGAKKLSELLAKGKLLGVFPRN